MLIEKLLLHVLIVLSPILVYSFFFEKRKVASSPYFYGMLHSISACLCLIFSFYHDNLYWDLRYAPLVLAFLYGGRRAGLMVFTSILVVRTILGGDAILLAFIGTIVASLIPYLYSRKFWNIHAEKRVSIALLMGIWPSFVQIAILLTYTVIFGVLDSGFVDSMLRVMMFGAIQVLGIGTAAKLSELMIERSVMKEEILRAEKLNTMGELAASIAHEVRNPLTVVKGFLQLIQKDNQANHPYLPLILSELGRAEVIISDYLNFAKPEFKKLEQFALSTALSDVIILLNALAIKQGVELKGQWHGEASLFTDRNQLKQALVNVIKNAIEATPDGGMVNVSLSTKGNEAIITVADTGKGMTSEQLSRIGTVFYTTKDKGTGLGTTVSVRIIESMHGKVSYESEEGKGTQVTLTLPIHQAEQVGM